MNGQNEEFAINWLLAQGDDNSTPAVATSTQTAIVPVGEEQDEELNRVLALSLENTGPAQYEPLNPDQRQRKEGVPVGLKNIGSTGFLNGLLQSMFSIPMLYEEVMRYSGDVESPAGKLIDELKSIFGYLALSNRKYADPQSLLNVLVDDYGNRIEYGGKMGPGQLMTVLATKIINANRKQQAEQVPDEEMPDETLRLRRLSSASAMDNAIQAAFETKSNLAQEFFGRKVQFVSYTEEDQDKTDVIPESLFGYFDVDIEQRDLYSAWDSALHGSDPEYVSPSGNTLPAFKESWLEECPKTLTFQVTGGSKEVHTNFTIPKVLYIDRFMVHNRSKSNVLRSQVQHLKEKVNALEKSIGKFKQFNGGSESLKFNLSNVVLFLQDQLNGGSDIEANPGLAEQGVGLLKEFEQQSTDAIDSLTAQLNDINKQIQSIWDDPEMTNRPYTLQSILVHENSGGSEEFFAYIYDPCSQTWRKYRDMTVTEVTEEEVFSASEESTVLDYCLFYTTNENEKPEHRYNLHDNAVIVDLDQNWYKELIPERIVAEIQNDNVKLVEEVADWQASGTAKEVQQLYTQRYHQMDSNAQSARALYSTGTTARYELVNFSVFLKKDYTKERLAKWHLLDLCVRQIDSEGQSLLDLEPNNALRMKLYQMSQSKQANLPIALDLTTFERKEIDDQLIAYTNKSKDASLVEYTLRKFTDGDLIQCMFSYLLILQRKQAPKIGAVVHNEYFYQIYEFPFLLQLALCLQALREFYILRPEKGLEWIHRSLSAQVLFGTSEYQTVSKFVRACVQSLHNWTQTQPDMLSEEAKEDFKSILLQIETKNIIPTVNLDEQPGDLIELLENLDAFDYYGWQEGWKSTELPTQYAQTKKRFEKDCKHFTDAYGRIKQFGYNITEKELRSFEESLGLERPEFN